MNRTQFSVIAALCCRLGAGCVLAAMLVIAILNASPLAIAWAVLTAGFWMFQWEARASLRRNTEAGANQT